MDVLIHGEGLKGESSFSLVAKSASVFELIYLPLKVGRFNGMITFLNSKLGEIWYEIDMTCEPAYEIKLEEMTAELGKFSE